MEKEETRKKERKVNMDHGRREEIKTTFHRRDPFLLDNKRPMHRNSSKIE